MNGDLCCEIGLKSQKCETSITERAPLEITDGLDCCLQYSACPAVHNCTMNTTVNGNDLQGVS